MFAIEVVQNGFVLGADESADGVTGRITIDDFAETFEVPLGFWTVSDYQNSWCRAFAVLEEGSSAASCLMASMTDPETTNFLFCWPLYRDGETVHIQNSIIFLDEVRSEFDPGQPWLSISSRCAVDEDGNVVSEWVTSMDSMREFFGSRCDDVQ
ncbi:hypothetical protein O7606_03355 [Micromonospora sp. WMMD882]|uniref:hypothetical protein n=1 Tax=Micromonospora sp. WMMD882 TaxID=3015151 RepID=UPI00248BC6A9|nr:hypothetical protein [Micromonospora sp. WMMD882]WBB80433.1 hypothetical protein O7606_03355 [Micromonospora sp. WMMD882]